ncbi:hypothetical protein GF362_04995 [Candidatus Dojkabacteria bacterium]|nr:hypothetical protein [Candidatus Dojkabacteria bacterium]
MGSHDVVPTESKQKPSKSKIKTEPEKSQEIPEWLKGDTTNSAKPVGMKEDSSKTFGNTPNPDNIKDPSKVHDSFGLTPVNGE